jgi:erythromycin esterase-like protein
MMGDETLREGLKRSALPLARDEDLDPLLQRIGDARVVLLGEASHGTHEYYRWRDRISRRLIGEKGFSFIAVEGDWPDCHTLNRYVRGSDDAGESAEEVLHAFARWPTWMWANREVVELAEWLRAHNQSHPEVPPVGFYGLDVYSLWESMDVVTRYLERVDPALAERARNSYGCFDPYEQDVQEYARATEVVPTDCEDEVLETLLQLRRKGPDFRRDDAEAFFNAEQNALVATNAERYYRAMIRGGAASWNVRDRHMMETLERLLQHHGSQSKAIVWEHNTHVGDARATDMRRAGMVNVGQLAREAWGGEVVVVGFSGYQGSVIAGSQWGAPMQRMRVPAARAGSWEQLLHQAVGGDALLLMEGLDELPGALDPRGHRAIGVVYHPEREAQGNYVPTVLPWRYDVLLYLEQTRALRPLHLREERDGEPPETWPSGM